MFEPHADRATYIESKHPSDPSNGTAGTNFTLLVKGCLWLFSDNPLSQQRCRAGGLDSVKAAEETLCSPVSC